jgi:uncharacterized protein (TIGR02145 family)
MNKYYWALFIGLSLLYIVSCSKENDEDPILFKVTTDSVKMSIDNSVDYNIQVVVYGMTDQENANINDRGVCVSEKKNPKIEDNHTAETEWNILEPYLLKSSVGGLKPNTTYHFRNFVKTNAGLQYGNDIVYTTTNYPVIINSTLSNITPQSLLYKFTLISDGGSTLAANGIVWSKSKNPTVNLNTKTTVSEINENTYSGKLENLEPATTYYAKCYAMNKNGASYSNEFTFKTLGNIASDVVTDIDGNTYKTIQIGNQIWMTENLRTTRYRNGDKIETTNDINKDITTENSPKYQWPANGEESSVPTYGRLYTWFAAVDSRSVAPDGWHLPTAADYYVLETYLVQNGYNSFKHLDGYLNYIGKSISSTVLWNADTNTGSVGCSLSENNYSGFNALPIGMRDPTGAFAWFGNNTLFWISESYDSSYAYAELLSYNFPDFYFCGYGKKSGCSIRCVKNTMTQLNVNKMIRRVSSITLIDNVTGEIRIRK